jgi:hypothetical protein
MHHVSGNVRRMLPGGETCHLQRARRSQRLTATRYEHAMPASGPESKIATNQPQRRLRADSASGHKTKTQSIKTEQMRNPRKIPSGIRKVATSTVSFCSVRVA